MYLPRAFAETDLAALDALVARDPFATLVTVRDGAPTISQLPVLLVRDGEWVELHGHWARANPQSTHAGPATVLLHGPHAYVSPGWYPDKRAQARVPTWNYASAELHGALETYDDEDGLADVVDRLSRHFEARVGGDWAFEFDRPEERVQLRGIVGFRFRAERVAIKHKLNQNHPRANREAVAAALQALPGDANRDVAALMRAALATNPGD